MDELHKLIEQSTGYDALKHDYTEYPRAIRFTGEALLELPQTAFGAVKPLKPTEWAWRQMFAKLGPTVYGRGSSKSLPADYLLAVPPDMLAGNLNRHIQNTNGSRWMIRGYGEQCRAVLSDSYARVDNTRLLETLDQIVTREGVQGVRLVRPDLGPDDLNLKTVWRDDRGGGYGIGVYLGNGETGNRKLRIYPMIQRHACTNSIVVQHEEGIEMIHLGSRGSIMTIVKAVLGRILKIAAEKLDQMIEAEYEQVEDLNAVLNGIAKRYSLSEPVLDNMKTGSENNRSRAGVVNAISYAAWATPGLSGNERADLEILAGEFLAVPLKQFQKQKEHAYA